MGRFLFDSHGRVARSAFCLFAAVAFFFALVLFTALYFYEVSSGNYENGGPTPWPSTPLAVAAAITWSFCLFLVLLSGLAVSAKRLHDRDKSAWWLVIFLLVPNALYSLAQLFQDSEIAPGSLFPVLVRLVAMAVFLWAFVELACLKGTTGNNRFGADPLMRSG